MRKRLLSLFLGLLLIFSALPAQAEDTGYTKFSNHFFDTFDTIITLMGYAEEEATFTAAFAQAQAQFRRYHEVYDAYNEYDGVDNLYRLNRDAPGGEPVPVEPELMDLLLYCKEKQPLTGGVTNIALGPVLLLWHDAREADEPTLPTEDALRAAAQHTDFDAVLLDEAAGTVTFTDPEMRLDLGAVAKGYATEQVAQSLLQGDMPSFLINAGGNVRLGNPPLDGRQRWGVIVQDPDSTLPGVDASEMLDIVYAADTSVVTSGDYQRYITVDGERYHHIISPETLMPATHHRSVTVVCEDSGWADMLSTALFVLPYEEGRALADSLEGVEAFWMLNDENGTIEMTDGMRQYVKSQGAGAIDE